MMLKPRVLSVCLLALVLALVAPAPAVLAEPPVTDVVPAGSGVEPAWTVRFTVRLPVIMRPATTADGCTPIPGAAYQLLSVASPPSDRPAAQHADLNLSLRGWQPVGAYKGLVDYSGSTDGLAPQLAHLFGDRRTPAFRAVYQVYDWNWASNSRGAPLTSPEVTMAGLGTTAGEIIGAPDSGYQISRLRAGLEALVLYAAADRLTIKYTRDDNVVAGYTVHVEGICVEPSLLALYNQANAAGRHSLPALAGGQPIGRARGEEIGVVIRDNGTFMDPRSRKDWWVGH